MAEYGIKPWQEPSQAELTAKATQRMRAWIEACFAAEDKIQAALKLHRPIVINSEVKCPHCLRGGMYVQWPCETAKALGATAIGDQP